MSDMFYKRLEDIVVVSTAKAVVGSKHHYRDFSHRSLFEQRGAELGVGRKQCADDALHLTAERLKPAEAHLGFMHLGR